MKFNIFNWLFTDPFSACAAVNAPSKVCRAVQTVNGTQYTEIFHYYLPWMIVCALGLLIPFYYWAEGRKRFVKGRVLPLYKFMVDKVMTQLAWLAFVGWILMGGRYAADSTFFAWRFWRYAWLAWALGIVIYWAVYFVRKYPAEIRAWRSHQVLSQYVPEPRAKRKNVAKAGTR
jgi:hypothetical protein